MTETANDLDDAAPPSSSATTPLEKYRDWLVKAEYQASQDFDKAILTLASGALGLSLALLDPKTLSGPLNSTWLVAFSWAFLALSLIAGLASLLTSRRALRTCIQQVDQKRIDRETPGGVWSRLTETLNWGAASALFFGVLFLVVFAWLNLGRVSNANKAANPASANSPAPAAPPSISNLPSAPATPVNRTPEPGPRLSPSPTPGTGHK